MSTGKALPLFVLMLAWTFSTRVHCQSATVSLVSTGYVEVTWVRQLSWLGVDEFQVNFTATGARDCLETVLCASVTCTFNSLLCGLVFPCTPTNVTVSAADYAAPTLSLVTGPEPVTNFALSLEEGVEYISWVNPSTDSSPCFEHTAVRVSFNGENSINYFSLDEGNTSKPLCVKGYGEVEVWTEGGDGQSNFSSGVIIYNGSNVVDLVEIETCEPVGCNAIELEWSYVPVCPDVAYFEITTEDVTQNASVSATNLTVTDLEVDKEYKTCIWAMSKDRKVLDSFCHYYCNTADEVPENLAVEPLSSTSLRVTWDPPVCPKDSPIQYELRVDYTDYYTVATTYIVNGLRSFTRYEVEVKVHRSSYYDSEISTNAFTLLPTPSLYIGRVLEYSVEVYWYDQVSNTNGYEIYSKVTWGTSQQHEKVTKGTRFTITGFNSIDEVNSVCVASFPLDREDLMSNTDCKYVTDPPSESRKESWIIAGIVVGTLLLFVIAVVVLALMAKKKKSQAQGRRQQQVQQEQQQRQLQPQYNYGMYNVGGST